MDKLQAVIDRVMRESAPKARALAATREREIIEAEEQQRRDMEAWRVERREQLRPLAEPVWSWLLALHREGIPQRIGEALRALDEVVPEPTLFETGKGHEWRAVRLGTADAPALVGVWITGHLHWSRTASKRASSGEQLADFPFDETILRKLARDAASGLLFRRIVAAVERAEADALARARGER